MVLTVDYNSVFQDNKNVVEKSKHYLDFAGTLIGYIYYRIKSSDVMSSIADKTFSQFLQTKGIIADLHERIEKNKTQEFNVNVVAVKDLLDMNIQLLDGIEKFSFEHPQLAKKFLSTKSILSETIENYYTILRISKKITPSPALKETSDLARSLSQRSKQTLEKHFNAD